MKTAFVKLLITTGKMPAARAVKTNTSGTWPSISYMVLAHLLPAANLRTKVRAKLHQQKPLLAKNLLLARAKNNIETSQIVSEKISAYPADIFSFFKAENYELCTVIK